MSAGEWFLTFRDLSFSTLILDVKALRYFETLGITYPTAQGDVSEDVSLL